MSKIILVERYPSSSLYWPYLLKMNKIFDQSVEQVLKKYQGFEGKCIAFYQTSENDPDFLGMINLFYEESFKKYVMLYVSSTKNSISRLSDFATPVGFDIGICEEDRKIYSSIFNEVLFGYYEELITFQGILNGNFLFSDRESAEKYLKVHHEMAAQGKDVEQGVEMTIYEIWKFNR